MAMIESLQEFVGENLSLLLPVDQAWQPTDFLPDLTSLDWVDQVTQFRESSQGLSNEVLVVLVGNMVTEEALPSYTVSLEQVVGDPTGTSDAPWSIWLRGWTAEENRHGDLLNTYLRLTGRVDMRAVERTVHHLIRNGFYWGRRDHEFAGLIYAAFQERATRVSHGKVAKLAAAQGDDNLARICRTIAADETRHETFYTRVIGELMERDPTEGVIAYKNVLKGLVAMPGSLMSDGKDPNLYDHFAAVTQRIGVYTLQDYAEIIAHLNKVWGVASRSLSDKAAKAQEYICRQPERYELLIGQIADRIAEQPRVQFSWVHDAMV
jgi:acyl-[acyl-carrier-protein] desaturase